ncbi:L-threonine aldolase [Stackebrandtia albiflava]|uniref:L-threonine aldolase n=1 Tax=Stackebrandtia albiflava TaxID=406432 RepID=A0A562VB07_9ACTN|nr:GntG family PLP-dependent aldolase [Stackebrandtia albiflava]TWJ15070.1 L-threonine aldolase [Stackebrandtia albiflava]
MLVDLRSDTVTRPTAAMREAMFDAELGDDVYGEDPTVNALEAEVAALLGHEAGVFTPSGSMANQIGLQLLVPPGGELLVDSESHILAHEGGAAAAIGGISTQSWPSTAGRLDVDVVGRHVRESVAYHTVATRAIAVENTHNRGGGTVLAIEELRRLRRLADERGLLLHLDGARLWNAHVASGVPLAEYGRLFDTVSLCFSKGLGAPVGSILVSSAENVARARALRKRMGGGMRQIGFLAAAARHAVHHHVDRLAADHARARRLAEALAHRGLTDPGRVETNIVLLRHPGLAALAADAAEQGVLISVLSSDGGRLLTHLDVDDDGVDHAIKVLGELA